MAGMHTETLAESAQRIMAEHPSPRGWQRVVTKDCTRGGHTGIPPGSQPLVYWRRRREFRDPFDATGDEPMWVVEQISTGICVTDGWLHLVATLMPSLSKVMLGEVTPWRALDHQLKPGVRITLDAANGSWVYTTVEGVQPCGGLIARWCD